MDGLCSQRWTDYKMTRQEFETKIHENKTNMTRQIYKECEKTNLKR